MYFTKLTQIFDKKIKKKATYVLAVIITSTILELVGISFMLPLVAYLFTSEYPEKLNYILEFFFNKNLLQNNLFLLLTTGCLIAYFLKNIFLTYGSIIDSQFIWSTKKYLSEKLISSFLKLNYDLNLRDNTSFAVNILTKEVSYLVHYLMSLILFVSEILILFSISALMLFFYPYVFISIFILSIFFLYAFNLITKKKISLFANRRLNADMIYLKKSTEIINGFREITIYNKANYFIDDFAKNNNEIYKINWKLEFLQKIPRFWLEYFIIAFVLILLFLFIKFDYNSKDILIIASTIVISASRLLPSATKAFRAYQQLKIYKPSVDLILKEIQKTKYIKGSDEKIINKEFVFKKKIIFKNLSFSYNQKNVFKKLNLEIEKNSMIGIYGANGVGKSTLMDILFGFIRPKDGNVLVDNQDIQKNILGWQKIISYIPQKIYLTDNSILENIVFNDFCSNNNICINKLENAIIFSGLDEVLKDLPNGINTTVGENGKKLSGGQIQRIGLARAIYKAPEVLVMDETTSGIDSNSSKKIIDAVKKLKTITRIIISHDIEVLKACEKNFHFTKEEIKELNL
jgi:ABC-type bacteriocin/lantibiotic exporter with double-glycine peptidase domain